MFPPWNVEGCLCVSRFSLIYRQDDNQTKFHPQLSCTHSFCYTCIPFNLKRYEQSLTQVVSGICKLGYSW